MASLGGYGGARRGAGRKKHRPEGYEEMTTRIKIENRVFSRWSAFKERQSFPTHTSVAEHLLDLADTFDQHICQGASVQLESTPIGGGAERRAGAFSHMTPRRLLAAAELSDVKDTGPSLSRSFASLPTHHGDPYDHGSTSSFSSDEEYDPHETLNRAITSLLDSGDETSSCSDSDIEEFDSSSDDENLPTAFEQRGAFSVISTNIDMINCDKVVVSLPQLLQLIPSRCQHTGCCENVTTSNRFTGCCLTITISCSTGHSFIWSSSAEHINASGVPIFSNNLLLSASLLFSGNAYNKIQQMFSCFRLHFPNPSMFYRYQSAYLIPAVERLWSAHQSEVIAKLQGKDLVVSGDGRCDSPGSSAKFCSYTIADIESDIILHTETVTKAQVDYKSPNMERLGLRKTLNFMTNHLTIVEVATDASTSIKAMLARDYPQLFHSLDVWHKSKKLKKALAEAAKSKNMGKIALWSEKILNHFWHCCEVADDSVETLKVKWVSVLHHVCDKHEWATGECDHGDQVDDHIAYFADDEPAFEVLQKIVLDKKWLTSLKHYVRFRHTGILESFHNLLLAYAPKRMAYSDRAYHARILLAALDHNHHLERGYIEGSEGPRQHRVFRKRTKKWDTVPIKAAKTYPYMEKLLMSVLNQRGESLEPLRSKRFGKRYHTISPNPPPTTENIAQAKRTRFASN